MGSMEQTPASCSLTTKAGGFSLDSGLDLMDIHCGLNSVKYREAQLLAFGISYSFVSQQASFAFSIATRLYQVASSSALHNETFIQQEINGWLPPLVF